VINKGIAEHGYACAARPSGGSVANLAALRAGELDLAIVQSDWQYHAFRGSDRFRDNSYPELRSVLSLHGEPFTVVARADSGIKTFDDLKGKRVNVGNPGSGQRATLESLMEELGWSLEDFARALELDADRQAQALCDNQVDAIIYTAGHPNRSILEATLLCEARIIPVQGPAVERLLARYPFYVETEVPGQMYRSNPEDIPTFGVRATLVSDERVPSARVRQVVTSLLEGFAEFQALHPALERLEPGELIGDGSTAPLHQGARQAFGEAGLLSAGEQDSQRATWEPTSEVVENQTDGQ
ncbi:MAG: TAXI family TRAP transporter solute-binding subunit, partial [Candidatus Competibacteraceae bacterium]|nr:TAXI family TRAP transporter solute-binding subunit [Candidatus Competibacteraceae bacterium]